MGIWSSMPYVSNIALASLYGVHTYPKSLPVFQSSYFSGALHLKLALFPELNLNIIIISYSKGMKHG